MILYKEEKNFIKGKKNKKEIIKNQFMRLKTSFLDVVIIKNNKLIISL